MTPYADLWAKLWNREVDLRGSTLAAVEGAAGEVIILLAPAYVIGSGDEPARNGGACWSADVEIALNGADPRSATPATPSWIADGFVDLAGCARMLHLSLPSSVEGDLTVYIITENGGELLVKARRMEVALRGEPAFAEMLDPDYFR